MPLLFITEGQNHRDVSVIGAVSNSFTSKHNPVSHLVHLFTFCPRLFAVNMSLITMDVFHAAI